MQKLAYFHKVSDMFCQLWFKCRGYIFDGVIISLHNKGLATTRRVLCYLCKMTDFCNSYCCRTNKEHMENAIQAFDRLTLDRHYMGLIYWCINNSQAPILNPQFSQLAQKLLCYINPTMQFLFLPFCIYIVILLQLTVQPMEGIHTDKLK